MKVIRKNLMETTFEVAPDFELFSFFQNKTTNNVQLRMITFNHYIHIQKQKQITIRKTMRDLS